MFLKEIKTLNAHDFLTELSPLNQQWTPLQTIFPGYSLPPTGWVFRGQSDATWDLEPSLFIKHGMKDLPDDPQKRNLKVMNIVRSELENVTVFNTKAYAIGIESGLTTDRQRALDQITSISAPQSTIPYDHFDFRGGSPLRDLIDAYTLAQHHGIATRFLDWSFDAYSAAFFAAIDLFEKINLYDSRKQDFKMPDYLSVWGMTFIPYPPTQNWVLKKRDHRLEFITPRFRGNRYIEAQKGLFTMNPFVIEEAGQGKYLTHDKAYEETMRVAFPNVELYPPFLFKINLAVTKKTIASLLILLGRHGYSYSSIYPTHDSIKKDIEIIEWAKKA